MTLWHIGFFTEPGGSYSPYLSAGILGAGHWAGTPGHEAVWGYGGNGAFFSMNPGYQVNLENIDSSAPSKRDKTAKVALGLGLSSVHDSWNPLARLVSVGSASVEIADDDQPTSGNGSISPWVNQTATSAITADAEDTGLGVKYVGFDIPGQGFKLASNSCIGTATNPCPAAWKASIAANQYNPALMPQGFDYVPITVEDIVGNKATPGVTKALVRVDHSAPGVGISGPITEQPTIGTTAPQYALKYNVTDGDTAAPAAMAPFGGAGTGEGKTQRPIGIATDSAGNVWVVDRENSRVEKFDANGKFLMQFGSLGTGAKQFDDPRGIAISSTGNIWVSEVGNKRVQEFDANGNYLRMITGFTEPYGLATGPGEVLWISDPAKHEILKYKENGTYLGKAYGSASNADGPSALGWPMGLATDPAGNLWAADSGNSRLVKFAPSGQFSTQFGSAAQFKAPNFLAIAPSGHIFVTEDPGTRVHVVRSDGTSLREFGVLGAGNHQLTEPRSIALGANGVAYVADAGNHRIARWTHGDYDPQSGVAKVQVKVDGQLKATPYTTVCATNSCSASGEWIYKASEYGTGQHKVDVITTDGVGLTTTKSVSISSVKDASPPQLSATSTFFSAPDGWLEQKTYSYNATATDPGGWGVKSLVLKIDGQVVKSVTQGCLNGGCSATLGASSINMSSYAGGAHPAELIATDVANQSAAKKWTINVNPKGVVPVGETTDTLEAFEDTVEEMEPVASTYEFLEPEVIAAGDNPGFKANGSVLESTGTPVDTSINLGTEAVTIDGAQGVISVTPTGEGSSLNAGVEAGVAAVTPSVATGVDTVVRPEYNGALFFTDVRLPTSPDSFTWHLSLQTGQTIKVVDDQAAEVLFEDGTSMALITAMPAHDATGAAVPTHLEVQGAYVTLVVSHKAGGYVYPVVAGQSFEVGYSSVVAIPPPYPGPPPPGGLGPAIEDSEAAEQAEKASEPPLTSGEFNDATEWLFGGGPHRNKGKPVTLKQARRIARSHKIHKEISAPRVNIIGGPGANGSGGWEKIYDVGAEVCSDLICDIWHVNFPEETNFAITKTGSNSGNVVYAHPWGPVHCGGHINDWWIFNLQVNTESAGTRGDTVVYRGTGDHLTFWCKYEKIIYFVPELPGQVFTEASVLIDQVFPNGFQRTVIQRWNQWLNTL